MPNSFAFLLLSTSAAVAFATNPAATDPAETLREFSAACSGIDEIEPLSAIVPENGWESIGNDEVDFLARRIDSFERSVMFDMGGRREMVLAFRKMVGDKQLYLLLQDHRMPEDANLLRWTTCELFDLSKPPSYEQAAALFGTTHSRYDDDIPPNKDLQRFPGLAWFEEFSLAGSDSTRIWTQEDEERGPFVIYQARSDFWKPGWGALDRAMPRIPPPPRPVLTSKTDADHAN